MFLKLQRLGLLREDDGNAEKAPPSSSSTLRKGTRLNGEERHETGVNGEKHDLQTFETRKHERQRAKSFRTAALFI